MNTATQKSKVPPLVIEKLMNWDLSQVRSRMLDDGEYSDHQLDDMELEYKRFLALCVTSATKGSRVVISQQIDPMWHNHILFTRDYKALAESLGCKYLHHEPASKGDLASLQDDYDKTIKLYEANFGAPNTLLWPKSDQICGGKNCSCSGTGN